LSETFTEPYSLVPVIHR